MRHLVLAVSLLSFTAGAHASLESLVKAAKDGQPIASVMQQAKAENTAVDTLLADLIKAGVVSAKNVADAVAAAIAAAPERAGALVTVALSNFPTSAPAILSSAFAAAPGKAREITAAAKTAGVSDLAVMAARSQARSLALGSPTLGVSPEAGASAITVAPFSGPSAGGGGGGGSASPN